MGRLGANIEGGFYAMHLNVRPFIITLFACISFIAAGCGSSEAPQEPSTSTPDVLTSGSSNENEGGEESDTSSTPDEDSEGQDTSEGDEGDSGPSQSDSEDCVPSCEGIACGDDGCGGSCGSCVEDDNPCTDAVCVEGACTSTFTELACDDEDACTENDMCAEGVCTGEAINCEDDNECTVNWCNQGNCMSEVSEEAECELRITIETPERAATLENVSVVVVSGVVNSPAGIVDHITLNGEDIGVTNEGTFSKTMVPTFGLNILSAEATNSADQTTRVAQSFLHGESFNPIGSLETPTMLSDAMGFWLSPEAFDDNDISDVDDLSTLAFLVLDGLDLNSFIPSPLFADDQRPSFIGCDYDVSVSNVQMDIDEVTFLPADGGIHAYFELKDLYAYIAAESDDGIIGDNCADAKGPVTADVISVDVTLNVNVVDGKPIVSIDEEGLIVLVEEFDWTIEEGLASLVDFLVPLIKGSIEDALIDAIQSQVQESILPLFNGILADFTSFERIFSIPPFEAGGNSATLNIKLELGDASFTEAGVHLSINVGSSATDEMEVELPGTLANAHCEDVPQIPIDKLPKSASAEAYLDVDLSNQLLHGLWASGFTHITVTEDLLGDTAEDYGLSNPEITIEPQLPPVIHSCTELGDAELQLGDLFVVAEFDTNSGPLRLELFASATVGADLAIFAIPDAQDALGVSGVTPGLIALDLQKVEGNLAFDEDVIELLLGALVSDVIAGDLLTSLIGAFPLPDIGIGEYVPGLAEDATLSFDPKTFEGIGAHLTLGGELSAQ